MSPEEFREYLKGRLIDLLARKPRTRRELQLKGIQIARTVGVDSQEVRSLIDDVLDSLETRGFLDDRDYAITYISEQKRRNTPHGPLYIQNFLFTKGIPRKLISEVLAEFLPPIEERLHALRLARRASTKRPSLRDPKKLAQYLRSRGFRASAVRYAIDSLDETD